MTTYSFGPPFVCDGCKRPFASRGSFMSHGKANDQSCTPEMRLWAKIDQDGPNGCWIWTGSVNSKGYGAINWGGRRMVAVHRIIYQQRHGALPSRVFCLHKCDTPRCVNPNHIFLGGDKENRADAVAKKRHAHGETAGNAKMNADKVRELRRLRDAGWKFKDLCSRYGITSGTAVSIYHRRIWRHVQ